MADGTTSAHAGHADHGRIAGLGALFGLLYFVQGIVEPTEGLLSQPIKSLLRHWDYSAASAAWLMSALMRRTLLAPYVRARTVVVSRSTASSAMS